MTGQPITPADGTARLWPIFRAVLLAGLALLTGHAPPSNVGPPEWILDEPPSVAGPDAEAIRRLSEAARAVEPAMMYVGHPKGDSGTAFVISRKHRLLATNAHVAEIFREVGGLYAMPNGTMRRYRVENLWFHRDYGRVRAVGTSVIAAGRWVRGPRHLVPDVAVLQLSAEGPDLPAECRLARRTEVHKLLSGPVGSLGFSGPWPPPGSPMQAVFKAGTVSLLTDFTPAWDRSRHWTLVDYSAPGAEGDSGGPVFSPDGRVVAIFAWSRVGRDQGDGRDRESSAGLSVDALWELLVDSGFADLASY